MSDDRGDYRTLHEFFVTGVLPEGSGKTWTYDPVLTVTVSARAGLGIGLRLIRDSLIALWRRETVTFEAGQDSPPYTFYSDDA